VAISRNVPQPALNATRSAVSRTTDINGPSDNVCEVPLSTLDAPQQKLATSIGFQRFRDLAGGLDKRFGERMGRPFLQGYDSDGRGLGR
jgi:hypothetical protein